ncbi:MAG: GDP-mannose 4,6-dehydratase [Bryobacteraceae bacterium]
MNVLVTGGAGFIGSHLAGRLLAENNRVSIFDDLNDFYDPSFKSANLASLRRGAQPVFHEGDICDWARIREVVERDRPEVIVHLAARAGVRPSLEQPQLYERVNVGGTVNLLEAARLYGVRKFVFASSSSVYGASDVTPFREDSGANLPISPYAATKIAGEKLCYTWSHLYGIDVVCLRFFTVYGPRQRPDLAIRKFTTMIDHGQTIPVFGDGSTSRDYTFVDDIVSGIRAAIDLPCRYEIFNLGNSSPVPLTRLISVIEEALEVKARIKRLPDQPGDVPITYADISKAQRMLGYLPHTPLEEGIRRFVAWYRTVPNSPSTNASVAAATLLPSFEPSNSSGESKPTVPAGT